MTHNDLQMVTEGLLQHLMTLIAVVYSVTVVTLAICLVLIMKFNYLYQPCWCFYIYLSILEIISLSSSHFFYPAVCVGQLQFRDQYFDTPKFDLTLRDVWLRKRKGCWELKCPATVNVTEGTGGERSKAQAALCTRYKEITNLPEIQLRVKEVIKDICADRETNSSQEDESWLSKMNLVCFAEFTTVRRSFTLEEEGVQIDLDQADFGYHVGEIEVLVPEGGDVQSALEKIERTARKLGELKAVKLPSPLYKYNIFTITYCIHQVGYQLAML